MRSVLRTDGKASASKQLPETEKKTARRARHAFTATEAKNEFGRLLEQAIRGETVVITKHDAPKAVLISMEEYDSLRSVPERNLERLSSEFDAMLTHMQGTKAQARMKAAFHATPEQLGRAAVRAARRRG